jgi:hypothetical protein
MHLVRWRGGMMSATKPLSLSDMGGTERSLQAGEDVGHSVRMPVTFLGRLCDVDFSLQQR